MNVSSTYLTHIFGCSEADLRAFSSNISIYKFGTTGESVDPIAAPSSCSYKLSPNWKYVDLRHKLVSRQISPTDSVVLASSDSSFVSFSMIASMASSNGTFVKRLVTSKLIRRSASSRVVSWIFRRTRWHVPSMGKRSWPVPWISCMSENQWPTQLVSKEHSDDFVCWEGGSGGSLV